MKYDKTKIRENKIKTKFKLITQQLPKFASTLAQEMFSVCKYCKFRLNSVSGKVSDETMLGI